MNLLIYVFLFIIFIFLISIIWILLKLLIFLLYLMNTLIDSYALISQLPNYIGTYLIKDITNSRKFEILHNKKYLFFKYK